MNQLFPTLDSSAQRPLSDRIVAEKVVNPCGETAYVFFELVFYHERVCVRVWKSIRTHTRGGAEMDRNIDTIFFDVGATLRYVVEDPAFAAAAEKELMELVGTKESHDVFFEKLEKNWKAYRKWAKTALLDVSEMELWMQYLLPDYPMEKIAPNAARLTRLWRDHDGRRVPHDGVKETLWELKRRGYKLGIIANTITETEIPDWMCADGVAECFKTVILSS